MLIQQFPPVGKERPLQVCEGPDLRRWPRRTVFVDRDGVVNVNRPDHVKSWAEFEFLPGALDGLALLAGRGLQTVVITNQAVVNRGVMTQTELEQLHARMAETIAAHGGHITAVLACPHRPDEGCGCRKPAPGLLHGAAARLGARLDDAVLVGDHLNDLEAADRAGCRSILVLSGRGREWAAGPLPNGCFAVLPDLLAAAQRIVGPLPLTPSPTGRGGTRTRVGSVPPSLAGKGVRGLGPGTEVMP